MKVEELKRKVQGVTNFPVCKQRLIYAGEQLQDGATLDDYNMKKESTIHLVLHSTGC